MEGPTVEEELEAVRSIFPEELSASEGDDGSKLVQYKVKGDLVLTVKLNGMSLLCMQ